MRNIVLFLLIPFILQAQKLNESSEYLQGQALYAQTCVSCHGDGQTNAEIKLTVKPRRLKQSILSQTQMAAIIADGSREWGARSDIMPAFKYLFSQKQINNIALFVSHTYNPNRTIKIRKLLKEAKKEILEDAEMLKIGEKIFTKTCSKCHGSIGNGESEYVEQSKSNKEFIYPYNLTKIILNEDQIFLYAKFGGNFWGTDKNDMPSWKKKYNDTKLKSVAKYVYEVIKQKK